jgi:hypothetical protein
MIFTALTYQSAGWGNVLGLSLIGFLAGLVTKLGPRMRFFDITAAQHPEIFPSSRLPALPGSVLAALTLPSIEILAHWNAPFNRQHAVYIVCLLAAAVSSMAWMGSASSLLSVDDERKQREIKEFLSDPNSPVPSGPRMSTSPRWLQIWNLLNFAALIFLMTFAVQKLLNL